MLTPGSKLRSLMDAAIRPGEIAWIGLRPARHAPMQIVDQATLDPHDGVRGDHYAGRSGARQVSLISSEAIAAIASYLGRESIAPELLRRNIVLRGVNLLALKERRFRLGTALLEYAGDCHPCSRMETLLGPGGYNAVRGHGGILARVLEAGSIQRGDMLERLGTEPPIISQ